MALKKCRECRNLVSTKALSCPKCGAVLKRKTSGCAGCLAVAVIGIFLLGVLSVNFGPPPPSSPTAPTPSAEQEQPASTERQKSYEEISEEVHQKVLERQVEQETYDALREMKDAIDKERIRRKLYGE